MKISNLKRQLLKSRCQNAILIDSKESLRRDNESLTTQITKYQGTIKNILNERFGLIGTFGAVGKLSSAGRNRNGFEMKNIMC